MTYTFEDGIKLLEYIGEENLSSEEKKILEEMWEKEYAKRNNGLISTIGYLYCHYLPFKNKDTSIAFITSARRDHLFNRSIEQTEIDDLLEKGIPLEEILSLKK
jgi:hypothetical protein